MNASQTAFQQFSAEDIDTMTKQAQAIFFADNLAAIIEGGEESVAKVIPLLIEAYPAAKQNRSENPDYSFADMAAEFSSRITGGIVTALLKNTRGAIANRHE